MELVIDRLSKQYKNRIAADRISITLQSGVHGLLGANGAGKTTLMRMICGILKPTKGTITFDGMDVSEESYRAVLGYLPQDFGYYPEFTAEDFLLYLSALKGIPKIQAKKRAEKLLELVSLQEEGHRKIRTFSGGMKQRLGIAQALLNDPKILILDEPTAGLDVLAREEILDFLREYMIPGNRSILISSHISSDLEGLCDDFYLIDQGKIQMHEETDVLLGNYGLLKVTEEQYKKLDRSYLLRKKRESFGYSLLTDQKQFYQENAPEITMEKGSIDNVITMMIKGEEI